MSATLAVFLKELDPRLKIELDEVLGSAAQESSNEWNNAGTCHAALCELRLIDDEPWKQAYVGFKQGADPQFVPKPARTWRPRNSFLMAKSRVVARSESRARSTVNNFRRAFPRLCKRDAGDYRR